MCIHVWIEKAAIDFTISRPRKRDVGASEKLIDGRMATAYLHNPNASADVVMFYSDLDRLFDDLEQPSERFLGPCLPNTAQIHRHRSARRRRLNWCHRVSASRFATALRHTLGVHILH